MQNRNAAIVAVALGAMLAVGVAVFLVTSPGQTPGVQFNVGLLVVPAIILFLIIIFGFIFLAVRANKTRITQWQEKADTLGDALDLDFEHDPPKNFHRDFTFLPEITKSGKTNHLARGVIAGRDALFFERSYTYSTGQTNVTVYHCVYSAEAPDWPQLSITPRNPFSKLLRKLGRRKGLLLDDPNFNHAFVVTTEDEPFAVTLLTPEMQRFLLEKPGVTWRITHERVFLIYKGQLKLDRVPVSVDRLSRFWSNVPSEVEAWERRGMI